MKRGVADETASIKSTESMVMLNKFAAELMAEIGVNSVTDVTGFGLLGHLAEMCDASVVSANIDYSTLPFLPTVKELAEQGIIPGGTKRNLKFVEDKVHFSKHLTDIDKLLCADAQTSGGLLISLPPTKAENISLNSMNYQKSKQ